MTNIETSTSYLIGMSPGNSYFKDEEVKYLLQKTVEKYGKVAIMIADVPAISTYIAYGYPENRARRDKAIPQGNLLKNRVVRAMSQLGYGEDKVKIIDWEGEVEHNEEYKSAYNKVRALYESNTSFQNDADSTTKQVLDGSGRVFEDVNKSVKIAVHYLLSEIAFLEWAPKFFNTHKAVYVYHKNWPVYENYIAGKYDGDLKEYMDFLLMENPWETYNSIWGSEDLEKGEYKNALDRVNSTKILRVSFSNYPPAFVHDQTFDNFSGIFYEVVKRIADKYGWEIKWSEETGYGVIIDGLEKNRFDIFGSTVWPTPERKEQASFSNSLYESNVYAWIREGTDTQYNEKKLNNELRVAVRENDISESIARSDFKNQRLVYVPQLTGTLDLLNFVAEDKADVTFVESYLANHFNESSSVKLVVVDKNIPVRIYENTFVFLKNDLSLKEVFDKEIDLMRAEGFLKDLIAKWGFN
jgi:tRNA-dependent cyclodipeptide synthase